MPSFLPVILFGGALVAFMGGKKKKKPTRAVVTGEAGKDWKLYKPSKRAPSIPGIKKPPATPGTPVSLKPFSSIKQIQESLDMLGFSPGTIDGAWGKKTSAAITKFQEKEGVTLENTGRLDPQTLGMLYWRAYGDPGEGSTMMPKDPARLPTIPAAQASTTVRFSADYSKMDIGVQWRYVVLEAWLKRQKAEGKVGLSGAKRTLEWIDEYFFKNPVQFLGCGNETVGGIIYTGLIIVATWGKGALVKTTLTKLFGSTKAVSLIAKGMYWFGITDGVASVTGLFNALLETPDQLLQGQMMHLVNSFAEEHKVLVGKEWVKLSDVPLQEGTPAAALVEKMMMWIAMFQRYEFAEEQ